MHFCEAHFIPYKKQFFLKPCLKKHALLVDPLCVLYDFLYAQTFMFFDPPKKGDPKQERGSKSGSGVEISNPQTVLKGPIPTKKRGAKGNDCWFWVTQVAQG